MSEFAVGDRVEMSEEMPSGETRVSFGSVVVILTEEDARAGEWEGPILVCWDDWLGLFAYNEDEIERVEVPSGSADEAERRD